jgi:H+/gluconate symporter-like permease
MMTVAAATLDHLEARSAFQTIMIDLGMLLALPLVQRLFGLSEGGPRAMLLPAFVLASVLRGARGVASVAAPAGALGAPSTPTRTPRWSGQVGP